MVSVVSEYQRMVGMEWRSGRGSILDWTESQQSDGDLKNLTSIKESD